jgi:hypothetical protein
VKNRHTGDRGGGRAVARLERLAGARERAAVGAAVEAGDLLGVGGHEVVAEAGVEVLDHGDRRRVRDAPGDREADRRAHVRLHEVRLHDVRARAEADVVRDALVEDTVDDALHERDRGAGGHRRVLHVERARGPPARRDDAVDGAGDDLRPVEPAEIGGELDASPALRRRADACSVTVPRRTPP